MPTYRETAESFGTDAERYDRTRPRYPDAMISRIAAAAPGRTMLDVGCGTGIAARQFQAAGCTVLGVDPDPRMAALARGFGLDVEVARFEDWDPAGRTFDLVTAAQSWHWIDPVAGAAKAARALRPGGRFAAFWNAADPAPDLAGAFAEVYTRVVPGLPTIPAGMSAADGYALMLDKAATGLTTAFTEPDRWRFTWERTYTRDEYLDLIPTQGTATLLPAATLKDLLDGLGAAIDKAGGAFTVTYTALVITSTLA
ncbi:class I SAM-dependent methyltransferase [Winogradskya humida]|uniref:Methyltransferase type 11 n=1 Tax=Winogradskya humida TaxID=113566 RepID=A0ABQ3ZUI9_9ACTN|nr:class I SAM-dependent methyltransferase [Actinoplanes humidus]GIE22270.1 methyltransferase type 11 [Actinoplanes humidus]